MHRLQFDSSLQLPISRNTETRSKDREVICHDANKQAAETKDNNLFKILILLRIHACYARSYVGSVPGQSATVR